MLRLMSALLLIAIWNVCPIQSPQRASVETSSLEGAYEFVSETTALTKPKKLTEQHSSSQWVGLWLFTDGHFSQTLMKRERRFWIPRFPRNPEELGYRSVAGTFKIEGRTLNLIPRLRLSPYYIDQPWLLGYRLEGETLTLTETLHPNPHNDSEGQRTIVLRRIKTGSPK